MLSMAANMRVHMALLFFTSLLLAEERNHTVFAAAAANSSQLFLPGCPQDCGNGVLIPYPFGIGPNVSNCFWDVRFRVECIDHKPYMRSNSDEGNYEITDISIATGEVRILVQASRMCHGSSYSIVSPYYGNVRFSHSKNKVTAVGCDTLGTTYATLDKELAFGCLATCRNRTDSLVADDICSGFGCCQASIPPRIFDLYLEYLNPDNTTGIKYEDPDDSLSCGYIFIVEAAKYTFKKSHLSWRGNQTFPVVLEFSIYDPYFTESIGACEKASTNMSAYACKDRHSFCSDVQYAPTYNVTVGYICNCSGGYSGNPYLVDGCHDIDECQDPSTYPCDGHCVNTPGSYYCNKYEPSSPRTIGIIIGVSSGLGGLIFFMIITFVYKRIHMKKLKLEKERFFRTNYNLLRQQHQLSYGDSDSLIEKIKFFPLKDIQKATDNFDSTRIVGQGGHGTVYKGLLELKVVAIKRPKFLVQNEIVDSLNEVILLSQINHRNVVRLIGCCLETEVTLLVYEFISNGTLFDHIHMSHGEATLSWEDRLRISTDISAGLSYLHTAANVFILHRDIKTTNILLDERLTAKISDFGASKAIDFEKTHLTTNVQGTLGYMDPEYMHTGQLTNKTDVYSLGVILVELLTGQRPYSTLRSQQDKNLISHFKEALLEDRLSDMVEDTLIDDANIQEVLLVAKLAMNCLNMRGNDRPSMKDVEMTLEGLMKGKRKRRGDDGITKNDKSKSFTSDVPIIWSNENTGDESTSQINMEQCNIPLKFFQR